MSDLRTLPEIAAALAVIINGKVEEQRVIEPGLLRRLARRVDRDKTLDLIADAIAELTVLATKISAKGHGFSEKPVKLTASSRDEMDAEQRALDRGAVEVSLLDVLDEDSVEPTQSEQKLYAEMAVMSADNALARLHQAVRQEQLKVLRAMINYMWHRADSPWEMMKRGLAITRRYQRSKLQGITMTEVARLLDEKSRCAAVSARERDIHDELLIRWGVRAPKAADPGLKSKSTCEKNRKRALGNKHRHLAAKKRSQSTTAHVGSEIHPNPKPTRTP